MRDGFLICETRRDIAKFCRDETIFEIARLAPDEGVLLDGLDHVDELDLGGEGVSVVDQGSVGAVPAVKLHRAAAHA